MEGGPDFSVTRRRARDAVVVVPIGEIDLATVDAVEAEIAAAVAEPHTEIVLDLRSTTFLDSTGIRLVVQLARDLGSAFGVVRGREEVARVFDLVGLDGRVRMLDLPPGE
jgi:anti-sigma B factor antagonist